MYKTIERTCLILTYIVFKTVLTCQYKYYHFHFTNEQTKSQQN